MNRREDLEEETVMAKMRLQDLMTSLRSMESQSAATNTDGAMAMGRRGNQTSAISGEAAKELKNPERSSIQVGINTKQRLYKRSILGESRKARPDALTLATEQAIAQATEVSNDQESNQGSIEGTINEWLREGRNITLPTTLYEPPAHEQAHAATSQGDKGASGRAASFTQTVRRNLSNWGILDSGATGHFLQPGVGVPTGRPSGKTVGMPNGKTINASKEIMLPMTCISSQARGDKLPGLHSSLLSVPKLSDYGYTTIFRPWDQGVEVYHASDVEIKPRARPVLQGPRDRAGL